MPDTSTGSGPLEALIRHDRRVVAALVFAVCGLAWAYTIAGAGLGMTALQMTPGIGSPMPMPDTAGPPSSTLSWFAMLALMWWLMMVAMMLPGAAPTILLAAALNRRAAGAVPPYAGTAAFLAGYLAVWLLFSLLASGFQIVLETSGLLTRAMASNDRALTVALLLAAGAWQLTPVKRACLRHCRAPHAFLVGRAGQGTTGAVWIGIAHGAYCLGCCWFLMILLFVGGVMNLYWIAGLALLVLIEKTAPAGAVAGRVAGLALIAAAAAVWLA